MSDDDSLEVIASFPTPVLASMARSMLESEGIDAYLQDEHLSSVTGGNVFFPTKLQVRAGDAERARELLAEQIDPDEVEQAAADAARRAPPEDSDGFVEPDQTKSFVQRCPACGSDLVDQAPFSAKTLLASLLLVGLPLFFMRPPLHCRTCDHTWKA